MSESDLRGTWKVKGRGVEKNTSPIIGMVYTSNNVVGVLVEDLGKQVVLRTKENNLISVEKKSLQIVVSH